MRKIMIHHFLGESICTTMDDVQKTLEQSIDGVNEFLIAQKHDLYPYLTVLVNGIYANVTFVPSEESAGLQAVSDDTETDLEPDGISVFYTNTPSEETEVYNDYVIPKNLAVQIVKEFAETGTMPNCTEWDEL